MAAYRRLDGPISGGYGKRVMLSTKAARVTPLAAFFVSVLPRFAAESP